MPRNVSQRNAEKIKKKVSDEAERKRRENALDDAIENTFPASDPVSVEQPLNAIGLEIPPIAVASDRSVAEQDVRFSNRPFGIKRKRLVF